MQEDNNMETANLELLHKVVVSDWVLTLWRCMHFLALMNEGGEEKKDKQGFGLKRMNCSFVRAYLQNFSGQRFWHLLLSA